MKEVLYTPLHRLGKWGVRRRVRKTTYKTIHASGGGWKTKRFSRTLRYGLEGRKVLR